jgi:hypothetical protein
MGLNGGSHNSMKKSEEGRGKRGRKRLHIRTRVAEQVELWDEIGSGGG